jgi:hypothetical protein
MTDTVSVPSLSLLFSPSLSLMVSFAPIAATRVGAILLTYVVRYISYKLSVRGKLPIAVCHGVSPFLRSLTLSQPKSEASWWLEHDYLVAKKEVGVEYG